MNRKIQMFWLLKKSSKVLKPQGKKKNSEMGQPCSSAQRVMGLQLGLADTQVFSNPIPLNGNKDLQGESCLGAEQEGPWKQ